MKLTLDLLESFVRCRYKAFLKCTGEVGSVSEYELLETRLAETQGNLSEPNMPNPIASLTTARLLAEAITPSHYLDLHRLYTDPLVTKNLASADCKPLSDEKITETISQAVEHWRQRGFGYWVFHLKKDRQFVGRGGLTSHQFEGKEVAGLGYAVMPDYWNQGFATEMARASVEVGFGHLGLAEIWSWALPDNRASQRVMEKLGFRYERDFDFAGLVHRYYRLVKEEWKA